MNISVDSSEEDHICFSILVFVSKKNQIDGYGLKNYNCVIENLSFIKIFYTVK